MELSAAQAAEIVQDQGRELSGKAWVDPDWVALATKNDPYPVVWVNRSNCVVEFSSQGDMGMMTEVGV